MEETPKEFERRVAALYRVTGAGVVHDTTLAGSQIDVLVTETTPSGSPVVRVVECKAFSAPVGVSVVRVFASLVHLLRDRGLVDLASIIAASGFTAPARQAAEEFGIELLEISDLERRCNPSTETLAAAAEEVTSGGASDASSHIFVIMPFSDDMEDVYLLGIREVAENMGLVVERADEILHNSSIVDVIRERISSADIVIAETTFPNPNVYYELGYAHGQNKPTILIAKNAEDIPFDLRGVNHVIYKSISNLREQLPDFLKFHLDT